jgi:hypothetical protein
MREDQAVDSGELSYDFRPMNPGTGTLANTDTRPQFRKALLPFLVVLGLYSFTLGGHENVTPNPNEHSRILLATALALDGTVKLDSVIEAYGSMEDLATRDGHWYSDKAPGISLAAASLLKLFDPFLPRWGDSRYPDYTLLRNLLTLLLVALPAALLPFLLLRGRTSFDGDDVPWVALLLALSTPIAIYTGTLFSHVPAAVLITLCWVLALNPGRKQELQGWLGPFIGGIAGGFAIGVEYPLATLVLVIGISIAIRRLGLAVLTAFLAGALLGLLPTLIYHEAAFGSPWLTGYAFKMTERDAAVHAQGFFGFILPTREHLWGILFSAKRGLIFFGPILALAPLGLIRMARRDRAGSWALAIGAALYVIQISAFSDWAAGWGAAARHLIPVVPLLFLPMAEAVAVLKNRPLGRWLLIILVSVSLGNTALSLAVSPLFPVAFEAPLVQVALRTLGEGIAMPNLLTGITTLSTIISASIWAGGMFILTAVAMNRLIPLKRGWVFLLAMMVLSIGSSLSIQWMASPKPTHNQEQVRAWMLERLGEIEKAEEIRRTPVRLQDL